METRKGTLAYRQVKEEGEDPVGCIRNEHGGVHTSPQDMVEAVADTWGKLFNQEELVDVENSWNIMGNTLLKRRLSR